MLGLLVLLPHMGLPQHPLGGLRTESHMLDAVS